MKSLYILAFLVALWHPTWGQQKLPVLRATSNKLSIREGAAFYQSVWSVSPPDRPDVFTAAPFTGKQRIVFYSDQDSLAFVVRPGRTYDFVVLLNATDSAYTRISTRAGSRPTLKPKLVFNSSRHKGSGSDTLRFRLDKRSFIHLPGRINGSDTLDFLFDTGAGAVVVTSSLLGTRVKANVEGSVTNTGADGRSQVQTSSGNKLQIGALTWPNASLLAIDYKGFPFDAVLGWVAFENKVVEIDYERRWLLVRDAVADVAAYLPVNLQVRNGIPYIECLLTGNGQQRAGWFDFDTGSDGGIATSQQFAAAGRPFTQGLTRVGSAEARGSAGGAFKQSLYALPVLKIGAYELYQLPVAINDMDPAGAAPAENLGSEVLRRFNWVLDFKNQRAYCKPNKFLYAPLPAPASGK